ncbi:hypothetical protein BJ972_002166 [Agromyces atrinae]|uniref:Uncharacterized protein n=1 Tax=Agromyces atrinae TaxID=592376 RepID=A0A852SL77_9MICO|nr:hypothetical protein [Agromyces atrinae]
MRKRGARDVEESVDVDGEHPLPLVDVRADDRAEQHHAGVVDEHVEAAEAVDDALHGGFGLGAHRDVGDDGEGDPARRLDLGDESVESVAAAGDDGDRRTLARESEGRGSADATARPGDEGDG